jgi:ABC-type spermidine/putrescine transport system permease subunit I
MFNTYLQEQKNQALAYPPPVYGNILWPMLSSFVTYSDYLRVLTPLLLLELWTSVTKEYESDVFVCRSVEISSVVLVLCVSLSYG